MSTWVRGGRHGVADRLVLVYVAELDMQLAAGDRFDDSIRASAVPGAGRGAKELKMMLPVLLGALTISGCAAFGGDMLIRVSGSVPMSGLAENASASESCELGMVSAETGEQSPTRGFPADFSTTMMVVAGRKPKAYYFVLECEDGRKFRSSDVAISSRGSYSRQFDLGMLVEER